MEIDYAAQGETVEEAQENFANGSAATVHQHLKAFGSIDKVLCVAPQSVWKETLYDPTAKKYGFSQVSVHEFEQDEAMELGFDGISFLIPQVNNAESATVAI